MKIGLQDSWWESLSVPAITKVLLSVFMLSASPCLLELPEEIQPHTIYSVSAHSFMPKSRARGTRFKHVCMCLFSPGRSCYGKGQWGVCGFDYWPEWEQESHFYPISMAAEQNAMAGPLLTATRPPCLSVEGTRAVLDHFPCIDQSKWNDLSGTQT